MTTSRLPEIVLTCRNGHPFRTKARGGATVRCKTCGAPKHVPKDRPTTARAARHLLAVAEPEPAGPSPDLIGRWDAEPVWDGQVRTVEGRPADLCPECDGPLLWEPGRTLTYCQPCQRIGLPAAVAEHYERAERGRAEIAVRDGHGAPEDPAARAELRARKEIARKDYEAWLEGVADEYSYDRPQWQAQARHLAALIRGFLPEIDNARDADALAKVRRQINALLTGEQCKALQVEYREAQDRAERQWEAKQRAAEYERELAEQAERAERERREAERERERAERAERERAERQRAALPASGRRAITSGKTVPLPKPPDNPYVFVGAMIAESVAKRERALKDHGECQFAHWGRGVASRLYGVPVRDWAGNMTGYRTANTPAYLACSKHYAEAEARLRREGHPDIAWWEA